MTRLFLILLELEGRILAAERPVEVAFLAMEMVHGLIPYRQAALWDGAGLTALSGVATVEAGTPYGLWLARVFRFLTHRASTPPSSAPLTAADLPPELAGAWGEWLPAHALYLPMGREALLYAREEAFSVQEIALLTHLAAVIRVARQALMPRRRWRGRGLTGRRGWGIAALLLLAGAFPVTGSVLAPAEAVPAHPAIVRAPLDGVVDRMAVPPDTRVEAGQDLFALDSTQLTGRLDVARQQWATADAEYRQAAQAMVFDPKAKAQGAILAGRAEEKAAEVRLLENQLARITAKAPRAGIAVYDDPADWIGRPVVVGEKVMAVVDAEDTEVEAWVATADVGEVMAGSRLTLFLNTAPLSPLRATVRSVAYEATARPDNTLAHRVRAVVGTGADRPRLGLKGTARIDGDTVPLVWWLFRKPLAAVRQMVGI